MKFNLHPKNPMDHPIQARDPVEDSCSPVACRDCGICRLGTPSGQREADPRLLERIARNRRQLKRGELLYRIGEPMSALYAIRFGSIKTYVLADDGRAQITGFHIAGDPIGLADFSRGSHSSEARVLENTSLCEIPIEHLRDLMQELPEMRDQMLNILSHEVERYQNLTLMLGKKNAEEKLASFLLGLSNRFASRGFSSNEFVLSMSRSDIGTYLGIVEETVCRVLTRFQEEGLIENRRRLIRLSDIPRLRSVAMT